MPENTTSNRSYGVDQALLDVMPAPIISRRNPTVNDRKRIGQMWVNRTANTCYVLVDLINNQAIWGQNANVVGAFNVGGIMTAGNGLVATAGGLTVTAGGATITAGDVDVTVGDIDVAAGDINVALGAITVTTGAITATAGNIVATNGNFVATNGNVLAANGDITAGLGNIEATVGTITAGGNIASTNGSIGWVGGPVIMQGNGVPVHPAVPAALGNIYINTAGGAGTTLYVCEVAGNWAAK